MAAANSSSLRSPLRRRALSRSSWSISEAPAPRGRAAPGHARAGGRRAAAVGVGEFVQRLAAQQLGAEDEQDREEQEPDRLVEGGDRRPGDQGDPDDGGDA